MDQIKTGRCCKWLACCLLAAAFFAGCRSETPPAPPPPPPPAPFQPQIVVIDLGTHGGKTTLISTQAGGWTRNGEEITSGTGVRGENGAGYVLTLSNGQWSSEFVLPDPVSVALGTSGEATLLQPLEDGSFEYDGAPLASGQVRAAPNGSRYRFTLSPNGTWTTEFVPPQPIVVRLGTSNVSVRIRVVEHNRYELNGEPISGGQDWTSENGNIYRFELASNGIWTASFVSSPPISVTLGTSGDSVSIQLQESGAYLLDGERLFSGRVVTAANGNRYRLTLRSDRVWVAVFAPPAPASVTLGASGIRVSVQALEDGTHELDGQALGSGDVRLTANGNRYRFVLQPGGVWTAEFVAPDPVIVALGNSGDSAQVEIGESRTYLLDGELLTSGQVRTLPNGHRYRFIQAPSGAWIATYVPEPVEVRLGFHGGTITLTRMEDGSHQLGTTAIRSGDTVAGSNDHQYRLIRSGDSWLAEPLPLVITVLLPGTAGSIVVSRFEDGTYFFDGTEIRSGDTVTVNRVVYVLTLTGAQGTARRETGTPPGPGPPGPPGGETTFDTLETYIGVRPRLRDEEGRGTRAGSMLDINGRMYPLEDLFSDGFIEDDRTFVDSARGEIANLLTKIEALLRIYDGDSGSIGNEIERLWDDIGDALDDLFPGQGSSLLSADTPKRRNRSEIDGEEAVDDINDVLDALRSLDDFEDALDQGIFSDATIDEDDLEDVFSASQTIEKLGFGWTENTRFGAYSKRERSRVTSSLSFPAEEEGMGAFAYSPLGRARTSDLPRRGQARYVGQTIAASGQSDQGIYRGLFELSVRFNTREVSGLISELEDSNGDPWTYDLADVEAIVVPNARLHSSDGSFESSTGARGHITYNRFLGSSRSQTLSGDFEGRFLGTGRDAGDAAIGTWELRRGSGTLITGAFGVEYDSIDEPQRPTTTPTDEGEEAETILVTGPDGNGDIEIAARDADGDRIELSASELFSDGSAYVSGQRHFTISRDLIDKQLQILNVYIRIGDNSSSLRNALWDAVNEGLENHVFGPSDPESLGNSYPTGRSQSARDEEAIETLQDAMTALSSPSRFEDALGEDGVFEGVLGTESSLDRYDFNAIYDALDYEVRVQFGHTNYARFGAWAKSAQEYAVSGNRQSQPSAEDPDVFAYSPLEQAAYRANDPIFPRGLRATYQGETRAVHQNSDEPIFYDGDIALTVEWGESPNGSSAYAVIRDLVESSSGDPFVHNGFDVEEIAFTGMSTNTDSGGRVGISSSFPAVRIRYFDLSRRESSFTGAKRHEAKFVGLSHDGPVSVIGTWELGDIKGAYGADLLP